MGVNPLRRNPALAAKLLQQIGEGGELFLRRPARFQVADQADGDRLEVHVLILRMRAGDLVAPAVPYLHDAVGGARPVPDDEVVGEAAQACPVVAFEGGGAAAVGGAVVDDDRLERGIARRQKGGVGGDRLDWLAPGAEHVAGERGESDRDGQEQEVERFHVRPGIKSRNDSYRPGRGRPLARLNRAWIQRPAHSAARTRASGARSPVSKASFRRSQRPQTRTTGAGDSLRMVPTTLPPRDVRSTQPSPVTTKWQGRGKPARRRMYSA